MLPLIGHQLHCLLFKISVHLSCDFSLFLLVQQNEDIVHLSCDFRFHQLHGSVRIKMQNLLPNDSIPTNSSQQGRLVSDFSICTNSTGFSEIRYRAFVL
jgi:hypothetical protein